MLRGTLVQIGSLLAQQARCNKMTAQVNRAFSADLYDFMNPGGLPQALGDYCAVGAASFTS